MNTYDKIKWVLGIVLVFALVLATNLIDQRNFNQVRNAAVTIYEDRLIAKDILYDLNEIMYTKKIAALGQDSAFFGKTNIEINEEIGILLDRYRETKLTDKERRSFKDLQNSIQDLRKREASLDLDWESGFESIQWKTDIVKEHLEVLSKIQLEEGQREVILSNQALDRVQLFTEIEIFLLIIIAVIVQVIIMYQPNKRTA